MPVNRILTIDPGPTESERRARRAAYAREYRKKHPGDSRNGERAAYSKAYRSTEMYRAAQRKYRKSSKGMEHNRAYLLAERIVTPEKQRARDAVKHALRNGKLVKPSACEKCLLPRRLTAHHPDYSKRLDVQWLCHQCHSDVHREMEDSA